MKKIEDEPVVSVAIPCYNHGKYVGEAIESVLSQTYKNIELIVCDNGSQDNSYEEILRYKDSIAHCFRLENNDGMEFDARVNQLMTGKYRAILCSDDVWKPEKMERQIEVLEKHPEISVCATHIALGNEDFSKIDEHSMFVKYGKNRSREEWMRSLLLGGNCLAWSSALFRSDIYSKMVHRGYSSLQDYMFWIEFLFYGNIYVIPEVLGVMRWHPEGNNKNDSAPTRENSTRSENEQADIIGWAMENMPDDLFINTFAADLINPAVSEKGEIECEKFFILRKMAMAEGGAGLYFEVMKFFYHHYQMCNGDGDGKELRNFAYFMRTRYQYSHRDFAEWSSRMSYNLWMLEKKNIQKDKMKVEKKCQILEQYIDLECTEEEKMQIRKEVYLSLERKIRSTISVIYQNLDKIYGQMTDMSAEELENNYFLFVNLLQRLTAVIDENYQYFELIGVSEICCETWNLFRELLLYAEKERVDLYEAVIPYIEEMLRGLSSLKIPLEGKNL